uniref:Uncharacterized protein n=1 Tax=Erpetoichthys calabaricus TaxID=27687 RepID=A0A8C4S731_ERPCA
FLCIVFFNVSMVSTLIIATYLIQKLFGAWVGIVKGAGKQKIGAICNLTGYYIIGLPIGVSLMFAAHMGVLGFWIGLLVCVFMQSIFFLILVLKFDWKLLTEEVNGFCFSDLIKLPDRVPYTLRAFVADTFWLAVAHKVDKWNFTVQDLLHLNSQKTN